MVSPMRAAALASCLVLLAGCSGPEASQADAAAAGCPAGSMEHRDDGEGYAYCVPAGWEASRVGEATAYIAPGSAADGFGENVNVVTEPVGTMVGVGRYRDSSVTLLMNSIDGFDLVRTGPFGLGGEDALSAEFTGHQGEVELHWFQVYAVHDGTAYVATYTAEEAAYGDHLGEAKAAFATLRFT